MLEIVKMQMLDLMRVIMQDQMLNQTLDQIIAEIILIVVTIINNNKKRNKFKVPFFDEDELGSLFLIFRLINACIFE